MSKNKYHTIVVGGGIAGLTSAVYLARQGQKVLLIEKNKECGGLVNTFKRDGFYFEAGVRALESAGVILPMLDDLGIQLGFVKSKVSVGVKNEIVNIEDINSLTDYKNLLIKLFPESEADIEALIKIIRKIMKHMEVLYGIENPAFKDLKRDTAFIFKKLLPWLPRFIFTMGKINRMNIPIEEYLKTVVKDAALRDIISQHFFKNTPSFFALSYFSLYLDYFYPKGGVGTLAEALKNKILAYGGEIKTETTILEVKAMDGILCDMNKVNYQYDNLIWAADLKTFYKATYTAGLKPNIIKNFEQQKSRVFESRGGDSVFSLYLQVDEPTDSFKKIAHGHFFYTPSTIGLAQTHREELNHMLDHWADITKDQIMLWLDKFTKLNTYEISIPALKDPQMAPPGKTGMIISFLAEHNLFEKIREDGWYDEFRATLENQMLEVITNSIYPILKDKVIKKFSFSPLSYANRVGSSEGAITGWSFEKPIPVPHKIQYSDRATLTPIPSIFQAGQWAFSPAGVPMSILTGKLAADRVIKRSKLF